MYDLEDSKVLFCMIFMTCQNYLKANPKTMNKCNIANENVSCGPSQPWYWAYCVTTVISNDILIDNIDA